MKKIKLGVIGLSEGNGHPYSWSAIFNGYDKREMENCPFPVIPEYLDKQQFPRDSIKNALVSHVWTQNVTVSNHIARAAKIDTVVRNPEEMIGLVDAILLARDDAEKHLEMSLPFITAGLPIYIDKPLALSTNIAKKIYANEKYSGQIFTCSALSFAKELQLTDRIKKQIGNIIHINAVVPKDWNKYAIHIIEPVILMLDNFVEIDSTAKIKSNFQNSLLVKWKNGISANFTTLGNSTNPIKIEVFGTKGSHVFIFKNTFAAFKSTLQRFVDIINKKEKQIDREITLQSIKLIEVLNHE